MAGSPVCPGPGVPPGRTVAECLHRGLEVSAAVESWFWILTPCGRSSSDPPGLFAASGPLRQALCSSARVTGLVRTISTACRLSGSPGALLHQGPLRTGRARSAHRHPVWATAPVGVSTFRACEMRPGWAPSMPRGGGVHPGGVKHPPGACRLTAARPSPRSRVPPAGASLTRSHRGFTGVRPSGLPLACHPRVERSSLGFFLGLRTPPLPATHVQAVDGSSDTNPGLPCHRRHRRPPLQEHPLNTRDLVSHSHLESALFLVANRTLSKSYRCRSRALSVFLINSWTAHLVKARG